MYEIVTGESTRFLNGSRGYVSCDPFPKRRYRVLYFENATWYPTPNKNKDQYVQGSAEHAAVTHHDQPYNARFIVPQIVSLRGRRNTSPLRRSLFQRRSSPSNHSRNSNPVNRGLSYACLLLFPAVSLSILTICPCSASPSISTTSVILSTAP
jgi:hypothetical protein